MWAAGLRAGVQLHGGHGMAVVSLPSHQDGRQGGTAAAAEAAQVQSTLSVADAQRQFLCLFTADGQSPAAFTGMARSVLKLQHQQN